LTTPPAHEPPPTYTAPPQPRALLVLSLMLLIGLVLVAVALFADVAQISTPPTFTPPRPTNTPDVGAGIGVIPISPPLELTDYTFTRDDDSAFALHDLRGKYALLYFGYVNCPDYCPLTMDKFTVVKSRLGSRANQFNFVLVSVDPGRDTLQDIRAYLDRYDPSFIGLRLDNVTDIVDLSNEMGLYVNVPTDDGSSPNHAGHIMPGMSGASNLPTPIVPIQIESGYMVDHSSYAYLIDPQGRLRALFPFTLTADVMFDEIERVLTLDG